uniref:Cyclin N-terminal domain-containing protein n=1 Tax=Lactuca sativa TaxID=4236 RepID=A0A9R1WPN7_LACSA|nr:hypothetical protein LSAT_V11C100002240 [Lactuca sativa]
MDRKVGPGKAYVRKISPDTEELKKPKSWSSQNKSPQTSLSSTLTALSKAAHCPKQPNVVDIDAQDVDNELANVEYNETIVHEYMHTQPKMAEKKRTSLIDWLIEAHDAFDLMNETLYLTVNIVDRLLASKTIDNRELRIFRIPITDGTDGVFLCKIGNDEIPETQVMECMKMLVVSHLMVKDGEKEKAIYKKYLSRAQGMVAIPRRPKLYCRSLIRILE